MCLGRTSSAARSAGTPISRARQHASAARSDITVHLVATVLLTRPAINGFPATGYFCAVDASGGIIAKRTISLTCKGTPASEEETLRGPSDLGAVGVLVC